MTTEQNETQSVPAAQAVKCFVPRFRHIRAIPAAGIDAASAEKYRALRKIY